MKSHCNLHWQIRLTVHSASLPNWINGGWDRVTRAVSVVKYQVSRFPLHTNPQSPIQCLYPNRPLGFWLCRAGDTRACWSPGQPHPAALPTSEKPLSPARASDKGVWPWLLYQLVWLIANWGGRGSSLSANRLPGYYPTEAGRLLEEAIPKLRRAQSSRPKADSIGSGQRCSSTDIRSISGISRSPWVPQPISGKRRPGCMGCWTAWQLALTNATIYVER